MVGSAPLTVNPVIRYGGTAVLLKGKTVTLELNRDAKKRADKAIANIRLISSRVKRAKVQDAMQRCEIVVICLNNFRQYVNASLDALPSFNYGGAFKVNPYTLERMVEALQQVDIIYAMLTYEKKNSYKEERTQIQLLLADVCEYLVGAMDEGNEHATL